LNNDHDNCLREQSARIVLSEPIVNPIHVNFGIGPGLRDRQEKAYFKIEETSMIRGISKEKPAELLER
jgi:hypothetical protein